VTLTVPLERLGFHLDDGTYLVEPGEIQVFLGGSSLAEAAGSIEILDGLRIAPGEQRAATTLKPRL
jgi:beta-glucosidase